MLRNSASVEQEPPLLLVCRLSAGYVESLWLIPSLSSLHTKAIAKNISKIKPSVFSKIWKFDFVWVFLFCFLDFQKNKHCRRKNFPNRSFFRQRA